MSTEAGRRRRIILVNPPFQPLGSPSTGLGYVAVGARAAGHEVRVADLNYPFARWLLPLAPNLEREWDASSAAHLGQLLFSVLRFPETLTLRSAAIRACEITHGVSFEELRRDVAARLDTWLREQLFEDAEVIGFTVLNYQLLASLYLIDRVRAIAPLAKIIVGGFYVSADNGVALMRQVPAIDFCVHGEGDKTFLELLEALEDEARWSSVLGIVFRDRDHGPTATAKRPLLSGPELDALPFPDYTWIAKEDFDRYDVAIPVVSIRGCYWGKCTFCSDFRFNRTTYARSPASVVAEMEAQVETHRTAKFYFADLATNDSLERIAGIADGLIASPHSFEFIMLFVPDNIDLPTLRKLRAAGCTAIQYGVESLSTSLLKKMGKSPSVFENLKAIKLTELAGMQAISNIIKFFPNETLDEVLENYEIIARYPELLNGYVFGKPVEFRSRDGAFIGRLLVRRKYEVLERAVHNHYWPEDWSSAIPDIEVWIETRSPSKHLHAHLWNRVEEMLETNMSRRSLSRYHDDGRVLRLSKFRHRGGVVSSYELDGLARRVYLMATDEISLMELRRELSPRPNGAGNGDGIVTEAELTQTLAMLEQEDLLLRDGDRLLASIHPNIAELRLNPLITTVESRAERRREELARCEAALNETDAARGAS